MAEYETYKIENPAEWVGHEVEALLACQSGDGRNKELCTVTIVRNGKPEAFYRVRCTGAKVQDKVQVFSNWKKAVDAFNCI